MCFHPSLVYRWAKGTRPVSKRATETIARLIHDKHDRDLVQLRNSYLWMVERIESVEARRILYGMDLRGFDEELLLARLKATDQRPLA